MSKGIGGFFASLLEVAALVLVAVYAPELGIPAWGAQMAATFAASIVVSRIFAPNVPQSQQNNIRQQVPPDPTAGIPLVYGDAYTGARFVDAVLTTDQTKMYYVMAISCISPNGQFLYDTTKFYYQDRLITFDTTDLTKVVSLTDQAGNVDTTISGHLYIALYTSSATGTITPVNTSNLPSAIMSTANGVPSGQQWVSSNRQMNGTAFAVVTLVYNANSAGTTSLQPITFHVSHYLNGTGCAKPGDAWYDYLTNTVYGGAIDPSFVDSTSATALNTYSDVLIPYTDYNGYSQTIPRYRFNGVLDTGQTVLNNVDIMMTCCDCWQAYNSTTGLWSVVINQVISPSFSFDDTNIIGAITLGALDITQQANQVEAKFNDATNRDQPGYVNLQTPSGLLYPNEPVNKYTVSYDLINSSVTAQYLANRVLEQNRQDLIVGFESTYAGIQVQAGDVVTVTNANYGWTNQQFRVTQVKEIAQPDGTLSASFQMNAYNPAVYATGNITQFTPTPNSGLANPQYFSPLTAPTVTSSSPTATIPSFNVGCIIPTSGQVTEVTLFYTTYSSPTASQWVAWGSQTSSNSLAFTPSSTVSFIDISLPSQTYYFAFIVMNNNSSSVLSPLSTSLVWNPNPTTSAVAGTFIGTFAPVITQVPRTGGVTPVFTGIVPKLYGSAAGGAIDFVTSQTDTDSAFVNNTWRIGGSATTGYGDITTTGGLTLGSITDGGTYAQWASVTAMTSSPALLTVPIRYKSSLGVITQAASAITQFIYLDPGSSGTPGSNGNQYATAYLYKWANSTPPNPSGTSTFTWATGVNSSYTGGNGWLTTIPPNPNVPLAQLWQAAIQIVAVGGTTATTVSWASGFSITSPSLNGANGSPGANGLQTASPTVYQWAITIPSGPTGTSTYTWSSSSFTPTPTGWSQTIGVSPSPGFTLWAAKVNIADSATVTTTSIDWTTASIIASGYAGTDGVNGLNGSRTAVMTMYKWSSTVPVTYPSGTSVYTWASGTFTAPSTTNGWTITPGTPVAGQLLYAIDQVYSDNLTTTVTVINWTSTTVYPAGAAGQNGTRTAFLQVYKWAASTPTLFPIGTSTYTWANGTYTAPSTANGWTILPTAPVTGQILYACSVQYVDNGSSTTSTVTWTTSTAYALGASGTNGASGTPGSNGVDGLSSRIAYAVSNLSSLSATPATYTTVGAGAFPPYNTWGGAETWQATPPIYGAGQALFQTNGIYNPSTLQTVWNVPYLSNLKVGSLSAITVNTGNLTVTGTFEANTATISGTSMTGSGMYLDQTGNFALGNSSTNISFNGSQMTLNGNVVSTNNINLNAVSSVVSSTLNSPSQIISFTNLSGVWPNNTRSIPVSATITPASVNSSILINATSFFYTNSHETNVLEIWKLSSGIYTRLYYIGGSSDVFNTSAQPYYGQILAGNAEAATIVDTIVSSGIPTTYFLVLGNNSSSAVYAAFPSINVTELKR